MVQAISAFLEFSFLVHQSHSDSKTLQQIDAVIAQYLRKCQVFLDVGIRKTLKLLQNHSVMHYKALIQQFRGAKQPTLVNNQEPAHYNS